MKVYHCILLFFGLALLFLASGLLLGNLSRGRDKEESGLVLQRHAGLPPGYYLERSREGRYRPCRIATKEPLIWGKSRKGGSYAEALARAWDQYEYEYPGDLGWTRVELEQEVRP